jgi:hypothetical protein
MPGEQNGFIPVNERRGKYVGWLGYSKTVRGAQKTVYMSVDDIEKFVTQHNPYWTTSKAWKENRKTMEQKTVLLALLRKSDLSDPAMELVKEIVNETDLHDDDIVDAIMSEAEAEPAEKPAAPAATPEPVIQPAAATKPAVNAVDQLDAEFPPLPADWQAAKAMKEEAKKEEAKKPVEKKPEPAQPATRPYPPALFREKFSIAVDLIEKQNHLEKIGEREQKIVASAIDGIFGGEKTMRYEVCQWLTGKASTKEMSKGQLRALMLIMGVEDFNIAPKVEAMQEIKLAHAQALADAGQKEAK